VIGIFVFIAILFLLGGVVGWDLYRSLKAGAATLRMVTVSRTNDRTFFWIYIGAKFLAMALLLYIASLFLALAFPDFHIIIWPMTR